MKILFIASDPMEFPGLVRHCHDLRKWRISTDWARRGFLGEYEVALVANGVGAVRAAAAVDAAIDGFAPDRIASVGFCGALAPQLVTADIVVGTYVLHLGTRYDSTSIAHPKCDSGAIWSADRVIGTAEEKLRLYSSGPVAVEMEAGGVAARALALQVPFCCIKSVTDLANENMEIDFNSALRSDGHFDTIKILFSSLRHPSVRLPELFRLRKRCTQAANVLGDFVADCRF